MSNRVGESENIKDEGKEAKTESQSQTTTEQPTEQQPEAKIEAKTETRLPTPSIYARKSINVYDEILKLGDEPLTFKSIMDRQLVASVLLAENIARLQREAEWKFKKWLAKRGKDLPPDAREKQATYLWIRQLIDTLAYYVNGAFGITGGAFITQTQFMLNLHSKIKNKPISQWLKTAEETLNVWKNKPSVNVKALTASTHLCLKLMTYLTQP
jgi:hypothetical protein